MTDIQKIREVLLRMAMLLRLTGRDDWADALDRHRGELMVNPSATGGVLSLYGGMGSLNDLVLYKGSLLLTNENNELDALRSQLYELCHE